MANDLGNLATLRLDDSPERVQAASLTSMPDDLWRRIAAYVPPATTARALVVASGRSSSLRGALLAVIERADVDVFGLTRRDAAYGLVDSLKLVDANATRLEVNEVFLAYIRDWERRFWHTPSDGKGTDHSLMRYRAFLAYGADPNHVSEADGMTALILAIRAQRRGFEGKELVEILLRAGADPSAAGRHGMTPLAEAFCQLRIVLHECLEHWDGDPVELQAYCVMACHDLIYLLFDQFWPKEGDDKVSEICAISEQEATFSNAVDGGMSFLDVTDEYLVFFESALDAGEEVAGGFKLINRNFILHTMLQTLAKRSGRDPQDLFSHSYYKVCARIGEEFRNNASSLL